MTLQLPTATPQTAHPADLLNAEGGPIQATTSDIREALEITLKPGAVAELRIPNTSHGTISGFFDDLARMAHEAKQWCGKAPAIFLTLNPVNPALLSRAVNRIQ